jgi:LysM repeat protein
MSVEDAKQMMMYDLSLHQDKAKKILEGFQEAGEVSKDRTWDDLNTAEKEMLTDFSYNNALHQFPKFTDALIRGDEQGMEAQYKRYSKGKELTKRNESFADRYLISQAERDAQNVQNYLGDERADTVLGDMVSAETIDTNKAVDAWDLIGDAIRSVRSTFGMANDPKPIRTYEVRSGDTLSSIAQRLGTTTAKLVEDNNITNPNMIKAGQVIEF